MARTVIAVYRPRPGRQADLEAVVARHWHTLSAQGLVTAREPFVMRAVDGTLVEVFEWLSTEAIEQAHQNAEVQKLWEAFNAVAEYVPIAEVPEAKQVFSEFKAVLRP